MALGYLGRYGEALRSYQEAVRLNPAYADAYINIAAALGHMGRNEEALRAYRKVVQLKPELAKTYSYMEEAAKTTKTTLVTNPTQRLHFQGFSVLPPRGENWSITAQGKNQVSFGKNTTRGEHHTVLAWASFVFADAAFSRTVDLLPHAKQATGIEFQQPRFKSVDLRVALDSSLGKECVRMDFTAEDHGVPYAPGAVFILTGQDYYCLHPDSTKGYVVLKYSQRFVKGNKPLPIESEIDPFLRSLVFTPIQETPGTTSPRPSPGGTNRSGNTSPTFAPTPVPIPPPPHEFPGVGTPR